MIAGMEAPAVSAIGDHDPLRVLFFSEPFWPEIGGLEVITSRLVPALARRGHEILVVTDRADESRPERDVLDGVPIRRLPLRTAVWQRDVELLADIRMRLAEIVREFDPDVIHAVFCGPSTWFLPKLATRPMILDCHGSWPDLVVRPDGLFARLANAATWITACSQAALDDLYRLAPGATPPASILPIGLDPSFAGEPAEPPGTPPVLVCSGRAVPEKGMDVAIAAMPEILAKVPEARLMIAGDGPVRPELERLAGDLGVAQSVDFVGWVSPEATHELVARAHVVLVPSRIEGFGVVALEAALMARPVVASAAGGLTEAVEDGVTGLLVPPDQAPELAAAVLSLLADPGRARALGCAARRRALASFTAAQHLDRWDTFYMEIRRSLHGR